MGFGLIILTLFFCLARSETYCPYVNTYGEDGACKACPQEKPYTPLNMEIIDSVSLCLAHDDGFYCEPGKMVKRTKRALVFYHLVVYTGSVHINNRQHV